jgi:hypothetical protein
MQKHIFEAEMKLHKDTGATLSRDMKMSQASFSAKKNGTNGAQFNQGNIAFFKKRWNLSAAKIDEIFFTDEVS